MTPGSMSVGRLCDTCPAPAIAVSPGSEPERCAVALLARGQPVRCYCAAHWPALHPAAAERPA
jgi:hypothetical protein